MVRVISVHHFSKQHIQTVEQPTATAVAPPNRLLLAISSHCIEVRDLSNDADLLFTFPTVDEVRQILHCMNGDFIATLERKQSRQNLETWYTRVYVQWECVGAGVQAMRARIAGRVTPASSHGEPRSLEMIELPLRRRPDQLAVCQASGNLLVQSGRLLQLYKCCVRTHDISRLRFLDFEELPLVLELAFRPTHLALSENYVAAMNDTCAHVFTVSHNHHVEASASPSPAPAPAPDSNSNKTHTATFTYCKTYDDSPLSYKQMLRDEQMYNCNLITVNLPSIVKENSAIHKHCPFTCCDSDMVVNIKSSSPIQTWSHTYQIHNLLQLKLKPMVIEGAHRQITEEFKCLVLKPLYIPNIHKPKKGDNKKPLLKSEFGYCLNSVACMLTTQQEGYLYVFCDNSDPSSNVDNCIAVYPFTAPVYKIVLEDYILHALTETGLESYTLRIGHQLTRNVHQVNNINVACPPVKDSVCLVGLRPFIGVEQLLMSDNYLVLLANSETSPTHSNSSTNSSSATWTLYNLQLPNALILYNDFLSLANIHQFSSPQTYCHLISEAHMVLRITLMLLKWRNKCESAVNLIIPVKNDNEQLIEGYKDSCKLLGDYFVMCREEYNYTLSLPYYKMSQITPLEVLKRVQDIQNISNNQSMKGLLYYLKTVLLQIKTWTEADVLFTLLGEQNFVDTVLDLFSKYDSDNLSTLVLRNNVLREYATDKLINIFLQNNFKSNNDLVALAVLYLQRYMQKEAKNILESMPNDCLYEILQNNWELLLDTTTSNKAKDTESSFSELTAILITSKPEMLAKLLAYLVTELRAISLEKLLKVFVEFLPSHISKEGTNGSLVLQLLLEKFFKNYYSLPENVYRKTNYDASTFEALNILIRTYLSQLQIWQLKDTKVSKIKPESVEIKSYLNDLSSEPMEGLKSLDSEEVSMENYNKLIENSTYEAEDYLFSKIRWPYLDLMPPFCEDEMTKGSNLETDLILKKLQALLCSQMVPKQVTNEMLTFFKMSINFKGNISLQSIVLSTKDGTGFLLEKRPKCLLQYGKDRFTKDEEWTTLLTAVQEKIVQISENESENDVYQFHIVLLKDILLHLATNLPLQRFLNILPPQTETNSKHKGEEAKDHFDGGSYVQNNYSVENYEDQLKCEIDDCDNLEIDNYEPYILICKQTAHANHIKRLIVATGQKLLTTLNL